MTMTGPRNLTDEDVKAISDALYDRLIADFYRDLGKGAWAWIKRAAMAAIFAMAAYGAAKTGGAIK